MILHDLTNSENHPFYAKMQVSNGVRHYDFLKSVVEAAIETDRPFLSQTILKALNFHAIACLHPNAGMYRPCSVTVGENENFPAHWQIPDLMDDFTNMVNRRWFEADVVHLAAFVLWRLNRIHPFINGNGRTARAACLFVLCVKTGGWLPFQPLLPELIRRDREEYILILKGIDSSEQNGRLDLLPLVEFLTHLLKELVNASENGPGHPEA